MASPRSTTARRAAAGLLGGAALTALALAGPASAAGRPAPGPAASHPAARPAGRPATAPRPPAVRPATPAAARPASHPAPAIAASAAAARSAVGGVCASGAHPALAERLGADITAALRGRDDSVGLTVKDPVTGVTCSLHAYRAFDSASAVKATVMAAVLRRAQERGRELDAWETAKLHVMITYSDNDAATALWRDLGRDRFAAFLRLAGMADTVPGPGDYWGLTRIDAVDEMRLLDVLTDRRDVLSAHWRAYALGLMAGVDPAQRWGTPYGTPPGVVAHDKNGWLPRASRGWRVHSLGVFTGSGRDYRMVVLTDSNPTMEYGVQTIQRVALAVHRDLGRARA
ncbi:serine hydrolase [Streptacidiphilus sp. PB12-B1b]|uniref:serine hydrolase n=1 Tax=Streptacidiphilus sp. PB12-B1b TaxID=2705012 RepID=UPI0015F8F9ED|nr:serine hydrolase [Streptacidiphilus sp. PB12-B1b]QMU76270.1 serine hydrolase [Streptacidiphilus sp. PB12-B1b]